MKCDICHKRESSIHIKEIVNGENKGEINICLRCATKRGFDLLEGNIETLLEEILPSLGYTQEFVPNSKYKIDYNCSYCGNNFTDFIDTLDVNCPKCYEVFDDIIESIIFDKNNSIEYKGKLPNGLEHNDRNKSKLKELKNKLKEYVINEDYKNAAILRDQIKTLRETRIGDKHNDKNRE